MVRIGIIGCGGMGNMHTQACLVSGTVEVVAVADERKESAEKIAADAKCDAMAPSDLIQRDDIDAVMICTPTPSHYTLALEAIETGKHLFVEKPLTRTLAMADELVAKATEKKVFHQVGHVLRFWPEYVYLKESIENKKWGNLKSLKFTRISAQPGWSAGGWLINPELSGGAALDLHLHDTDMVNYLLGQPKSVFSSGVKDYAGWRQIFTQYFYDDGPAVFAEGAWYDGEQYPFSMCYLAHFEEGVLDYNSSREQTLIFYPQKGEIIIPELPRPPKTKPVEGINVTDLGGYLLQDNYFFQCLKENKAPEKADFIAGRDALETVEAEIQSAENREMVQIQK